MTDQQPALGSGEYGALYRQRVITALREEATRQHLFTRDHDEMSQAAIIQRLATAVVGVTYPELAAWKADTRTATLDEAAAAIQDFIDRDRAQFPARSNDRAALGGARQIVLGLHDQPHRTDAGDQP